MIFAQRRIDLWGSLLALCLVSWSISQTRQLSTAAAAAAAASSSDMYLYNTIDSQPILDHGPSGDFTKSKSPKVVEFYDPKCGACQAFKYNYIEVAKKVRASRPNVEFYGVSCAMYRDLCEGARVPKIVVYVSADSEGVQVEKGSGAIYFLSQRLLKALRSPDEIAAESASMEYAARRRLRVGDDDAEAAYGDADVYLDEEGGDSQEVGHEATIHEAQKEEQHSQPTDNDEPAGPKWDYNKLVEIKGVPREQWKPIHETDAWRNTMNELQNSESKLGAQFLKWKHEHDAKLRNQAEQAEKEKNRLDSKIAVDVDRQSNIIRQQDKPRAQIKSREEPLFPPPKTKQIEIIQTDVPKVFPVNLSPEQEKKFKAFIENKKKAAIRHERLKHPVKTLLGGGGDAKTVEKKKDQSPMNNYKSQYNPVDASAEKDKKPKADLRPEAQQSGARQKILSKVPIFSAFNTHSPAQSTLNDAALSFTRGLLMGVFKGNAKGPLDYKRKKALKDWFDLLSVSLPPEMGLHELIDTLSANIDSITTSEENLNAIVKRHHIPDSNWSKSCIAEAGSLGKHHCSTSHESLFRDLVNLSYAPYNYYRAGFFCGFWKLLHIMSLGVAEQAGGLVLRESNPTVRVFSTQEASSILREYMVYFFNCDKCVKRFVGQYDNCSFHRCIRLTDRTEDVSVDGWRQFPLWLWEVHNDISRSKANRAVEIFETHGRKAEAKKFERDMKAVYPHIDQCITCFDHEGKWNVDAVYDHLEREYW